MVKKRRGMFIAEKRDSLMNVVEVKVEADTATTKRLVQTEMQVKILFPKIFRNGGVAQKVDDSGHDPHIERAIA